MRRVSFILCASFILMALCQAAPTGRVQKVSHSVLTQMKKKIVKMLVYMRWVNSAGIRG